MSEVKKLNNRMSKIHPESLLNIPLVRQAVESLSKDILMPRAIDNRWVYQGVLPVAVAGFNPISGKIYCGSHSLLKEWIPVAHKSARPLNAEDKLLYEVLFFVHDYLHLWAYQLIQKLIPEIGFGEKDITLEKFEDFVFLHLVTEAAAVVGLDYWQLCETEVNEFCPIGSSRKSLAVTYSEKHLSEYRKFNPDFEAQSPEFFEQIATFYCSGEFLGFDSHDLKRSPIICDWIKHELGYGQSQRVITRQFLNQYLPKKIKLSKEELKKPVEVNKRWRKDLMKSVGRLLWDKVKKDKDDQVLPRELKSLKVKKQNTIKDFRFFNYNSYQGDMESIQDYLLDASVESRRFFLYQYVANFRFDQFDEDELRLVQGIVNRVDLTDAFSFLSKREKLKVIQQEPVELLILN